MFKPLVALWALSTLLAFAGCQTVQEKNIALVRDRVAKLKPLSHWQAKHCDVQVELTEPAKARYREIYPEEASSLDSAPWKYFWMATESSCQLRAIGVSQAEKNQLGFLQTGLCTLLQVFWVNSPFDELELTPEEIATAGSDVQIQTSKNPGLGIYLDPSRFHISTRTHARELTADYVGSGHIWAPERLTQTEGKTKIVLDDFHYAENQAEGDRPALKSFQISTGEGDVFSQSHVTFSNCEND